MAQVGGPILRRRKADGDIREGTEGEPKFVEEGCSLVSHAVWRD
jgi:hypothetical protein